eukprot:2983011-Amphidinium_carterae.1
MFCTPRGLRRVSSLLVVTECGPGSPRTGFSKKLTYLVLLGVFSRVAESLTVPSVQLANLSRPVCVPRYARATGGRA